MTNIKIRRQIIELIDIILKRSDIFEPLCDIYEKDGKLFVDFEIPGLDTDNLRVELDNELLIVFGLKKRVSVKGVRYLQAERIFGTFKKIIEIPFNVQNIDDIAYKHGILKIIMSKG